MFCGKCGTKVGEDEKFCGSCGAATSEQSDNQADNSTSSQPSNDGGQHKKKSDFRTYGIIACAVAVLILIVGAFFIFTLDSELDSLLVGSWELIDDWDDEVFIIEFRRDGSGRVSEIWYWQGEEFEESWDFTWRTDQDGLLWLSLEDEEFEEYVYLEIRDNTLIITDDWGTQEFTRVR